MGSQTWIVGRGRWAAKSVAPHLAESFAQGLQVSQILEDSGIAAGAPVLALTAALRNFGPAVGLDPGQDDLRAA